MNKRKDHWSVAEAKAQLSRVIDEACRHGPQTVTRYGKDAVVVVSTEEWERRTANKGTLLEFLLSSPLRETDIELELPSRSDMGRDVDL
jgi:prevent-host-death family protein